MLLLLPFLVAVVVLASDSVFAQKWVGTPLHTSASAKLTLQAADYHTSQRKGWECILDQLDDRERRCLRTLILRECMHAAVPVPLLVRKDSGRNLAEDRRYAGWPDTGYLRRSMDRCMGLVVVGWEENGMERRSVGCWMQMDQRYMDHTKRLVGRTRRNDLRKDVQDGQKAGDWRLYSQDVPRCWCPY